MSLKEKAPVLLPSPGILIPSLLPTPPTCIMETPAQGCCCNRGLGHRAGASAQGTCHRAHSPLEFWELLFVSSKWFCALLSTLRLKALSAGWGQREQENTMVTDQHRSKGGMPEAARRLGYLGAAPALGWEGPGLRVGGIAQ